MKCNFFETICLKYRFEGDDGYSGIKIIKKNPMGCIYECGKNEVTDETK